MPDDPRPSNPFGPLEDLVGRLFEGLERDDEPDGRSRPREPGTRGGGPLERFGRDLTADARAGRLDPVIGRDDEIAQVLEVLGRRTKNNPVLLGDPGVGKTAVVEAVAQHIADGAAPAALRDARIVALDLAGMVAGTKYRGEFEQRLTAVVDQVAADRSVVLFVDELHMVVGAGSAEGAPMDAGAILKPALARGELRMIGATTAADHRRHIEKDAALERRFEPVVVPEPSPERTAAILRGLRDGYQRHHGVTLTDAALDAAVMLSVRYVRDRFLPDKAIDLIDRTAARVALRAGGGADDPDRQADELRRARDVAVDVEDFERAALLTRELERLGTARPSTGRPEVTADDVAQVVAARTGVPVADVSVTDRDRLLNLEEHLHRRVVGQDEAVGAVADAVRSNRAGLGHPDRPVGSFLFLGPSGVGKTELARALSEALFGSADRMVRLDMSEYADAASVSRLVGAAPGYVGHDEPGQLTEPVRRDPYCVVLLDEIEKAHPDVTGTLLGVLDAGRLTDSRGRTADFRHAVIIMTSNLGADRLLAAAASGTPVDTLRDDVVDLARRRLRPEFCNRIDEIVLFEPLRPDELQRITGMLLDETVGRLRNRGVELVVDDEAVALLARDGHRPEHGARPLRRTIARQVERPLSRLLLSGELTAGRRIRLAAVDDAIALSPED
ncbi:ATP-dependent Clp protease ATP-binding subunit [Pseudonocardia endophytica]|uniref:ATP-dependent Clp protease ATP-binding subunit ClpA n=1 Tax=Pseudonocardia endophytica TaxID=401976 RepID=A0A4R1HSH3_PSEEN|nr:ATP-dependent Clp protease ATP-binding subunit [Pseudonocardia endophytica]TCK22799.1 ATP-dependent Clp protease ATP-binding subunit ClpA [Pseudonocardia endophytica]